MSPPPEKKYYLIYSTILLIILFSLFNFSSCQEPSTPEIKQNENLDFLKSTQKVDYKLIKNIAYGLANLVQSPDNREMIRNALNSSTKIENILEATEFLNSKQTIVKDMKKNSLKVSDALSDYLPLKDKNEFKEKVGELEFGKIDIYLPLEEWLENWKSEDEVLVAAVDYRMNGDESDILAFNSKGEEIYLSANEIPLTPTIVVYPSEKNGNYQLTENDQLIIGNDNSNLSIESTNSLFMQYKVTEIITNKNWDDGWLGGTMEIYIRYKYKLKYSNNNWSDWINTTTVNGVKGGFWATFNKSIGESYDPLIYQIQMWEWDGWLNGGDNRICDESYNSVYDTPEGINSTQNLNTTEIYNEIGGNAFRELWDGTNPNSQDFDRIRMNFEWIDN